MFAPGRSDAARRSCQLASCCPHRCRQRVPHHHTCNAIAVESFKQSHNETVSQIPIMNMNQQWHLQHSMRDTGKQTHSSKVENSMLFYRSAASKAVPLSSCTMST